MYSVVIMMRQKCIPHCVLLTLLEDCCILGNFAKWDSQKEADCQCEDGVTLQVKGTETLLKTKMVFVLKERRVLWI
ncbi:hypothetical protein JZ751_020606 [Albula glossodonta]|uniref:Uncharacterized protein n=1 Tax=Albula glossodonta TaxID=121402 RepID=A0A8T2PFU0_9TELE|nr:hypothetical protein JZ751_020606 [Albula glossodonta]